MIDLRSDTVTRPTKAMRQAIASAEVGDDVIGDDPTINRLESQVAELLGKEAALFVPSGTMSNQTAVRLHCRPGDEFLAEADCHILQYEQAAYAQLFGVAAQAIAGDGGLLTPDHLEHRVRGADLHSPRTKLVCLENTHNRLGGRLLPLAGVAETCAWAANQGLARHLDGARLWNACITTDTRPADWAQHFDTVSVCFSKGLGAPVGSALVGPTELVHEARRVRKALGGAMRQAGILAAAALHALDNHFERLAEDHANAQLLAEAVRESTNVSLVADRCDTNIVMIEVDPTWGTAGEYRAWLEQSGVLALALGPQKVRLVTHLNVSRDEVEQVARLVKSR